MRIKKGLAQKYANSKKSTIFSNQADILAKWKAHVKVILIEYQLDKMKNAGFLSIAHFCACSSFYCSYLKLAITFNCCNIKFNNSYHTILHKLLTQQEPSNTIS